MVTSLHEAAAAGVLLGFLPLLVMRFFPSNRAGRFRLTDTVAVFLSAAVTPVVARLFHNTEVSVTVACLGFVAGFTLRLVAFPREPRYPVRVEAPRPGHQSLAAVAGLALTGAPRMLVAGLGGWLAAWVLLNRRTGSATLAVGAAAPLLARLVYHTDLATILGGLFAMVLVFDYADGLPVLAGVAIRRERASSARFRVYALRVGAALAVAVVLGLFFFNRYVYRGFDLGVSLFRRGNPQLPYVALTFDDGPDPAVTPQVLDILRQRGIKATFFMVGRHAEEYPELARRIVAEGHEVGNHTYGHHNLVALDSDEVNREILDAQRAIAAATGVEPRLLRPPRGLYDDDAVKVARDQRLTIVLWSLSSRDWLELRPEEVADRLLADVRGGDVVLFHDGGNLVSDQGGWRGALLGALPGFLDAMLARSYRFVTVGDLMIYSGLTGDDAGLDAPLPEGP